jgi:hypothetical protein
MSVARAQREIDSAEFTEWVARDEMPGIHSEAGRMAGLIAAVIANVNRDPKARPKPYQPEDFFAPEPAPERGPVTNEELMAQALAFQIRANASLKH